MDEDQASIKGVLLKGGERIMAKEVVLTTGTFLRGVVHIGKESYPAGRHRRNSEEVEQPSVALS